MIVNGGHESKSRLDRIIIYSPTETHIINVTHIHHTQTFTDHSAICATYMPIEKPQKII